jgi:hypothetical protein
MNKKTATTTTSAALRARIRNEVLAEMKVERERGEFLDRKMGLSNAAPAAQLIRNTFSVPTMTPAQARARLAARGLK